MVANVAQSATTRSGTTGAIRAVDGRRAWGTSWRLTGVLLTAAIMLSARASAALVDGRLRVCVISLNEPQEVEAFRYHLDPDLFAFVDVHALAVARAAQGSAVSPRGWIFDACTPELTCDLLVISGEFAGDFFGRGPISLGLRDLEEASCEPRCAGLFRNLREVYLLGCNTLATKAEDSRTPETYLQVLLEHGFDRAAADRVVQLRYGPLGSSFRESLRRVFAGVPRLYGFSSVAPRAEFSSSMLANYLRHTPYVGFVPGDGSVNAALLNAFRGTSLTQTSGLMADEPAAAERQQICTLYDERRPRSDRLMTAYTLLARSDSLRFVPTVQTFLSRNPPSQFGQREKSIFAGIQRLEGTRADVMDLVRRLDISALQLQLAHFAALTGWIDPGEFHYLALASIARLLRQSPAGEEVDIVCDITADQSLKQQFKADDIPSGLYGDPHGVRLIACLAPADPRVAYSLMEPLRSPDPVLRQWAAHALMQVPKDDRIVAELVPYLRDPSPEIASRVRYMIQTQPSLSPDVASAVNHIDPTLAQR
jgi:hypothetical protein